MKNNSIFVSELSTSRHAFSTYHFCRGNSNKRKTRIGIILKGHGSYIYLNKKLDVAEGDVVFIPENIYCYSEWRGTPEIEVLYLSCFMHYESFRYEPQTIACDDKTKGNILQISHLLSLGQMEELERMASFIATSNRRYLLRDETGSRRFICIELKAPIDVTTPVDHAQLYAQALAALEVGERSWFNDAETRLIEAHNQGFSTQRGVWDLLRQHFEPCEVPQSTEERLKLLWPANHVYDCLREKSPTAMEGIERTTFGWYLKEIGAKQVRVDNRRLWAVRKVG